MDKNPANAGDLAELLQGAGYGVGADSPATEALKKLPIEIKKRVAALKQLQLDSINVEAKFYDKVHQLEIQFQNEFNEIFEKRRQIVAGEYEPTEEETALPLIHGQTEEEAKEFEEASEDYKGEKGIPGFWLNALKYSETVGDMIQEHDEPVLLHLTNITSTIEANPPSFTLFFHFSENDYFTNKVLTKKYDLEITPDANEPFDYDGPSVIKAVGDEIHWKDNKNITKKIIKKKQKKGANAGKFLTKTIKADSFFNFFDPPVHVEKDNQNEDDEDNEDAELERADFEVGQIIRDHIIPRAVLFFTGENFEPEFFDEYDEDEEEDYESDE